MGSFAISEEGIAQQCRQSENLDDKGERREPERPEQSLHLSVVGVPEAIEVVGKPAVDFSLVVRELVEALEHVGPDEREHEVVLR